MHVFDTIATPETAWISPDSLSSSGGGLYCDLLGVNSLDTVLNRYSSSAIPLRESRSGSKGRSGQLFEKTLSLPLGSWNWLRSFWRRESSVCIRQVYVRVDLPVSLMGCRRWNRDELVARNSCTLLGMYDWRVSKTFRYKERPWSVRDTNPEFLLWLAEIVEPIVYPTTR